MHGSSKVISKRIALTTDTDFARGVHHRAYREVIVRHYGPWNEETQNELFDAAWSAANHEIILCEDVPVGYLCVEDDIDEIRLHEIVIDPQFQQQSIGTRILNEILGRARRQIVPVRLRTHLTNRAADLYRRLGFQEYGRTDRHILMQWLPSENRRQIHAQSHTRSG
jgi:ribosomal protein S18 acetylase RimI-like enzyme